MKNSEIDIYNETEFRLWVKKISIALGEKIFCNMIEEHNHAMDNRKHIEQKKYLENLPFGVKYRMEGKGNYCLNGRKTVVMSINTSEKIRVKAYKFMNAFVNCISKIGGSVYVDKSEDNDNTMVTLLESRYKCNLYEKKVKLRNSIKTENRKMRPLYELEYNGDLCFEVFVEHKDKNGKWELLQTIDIHNSDDTKNKLADLFWKLRNEEDKICEERARIEKEELAKKQKIEEKIKMQMDKWEYTNRILRYINNLRSVSGISDNERALLFKYYDYVEKIYSKSEFYKEILEFSQELET